jgi:hypothetical protein
MKKILICIPVFICMCLSAVGGEAELQESELLKEIARLREENAELKEMISGEKKPINLARTSLATVSASGVNGNRSLDNFYYGVLNAFDEGVNINYSTWLDMAAAGEWVEVYFNTPVTVESISVDANRSFAVMIKTSNGEELSFPRTHNELHLEDLVLEVTSVRMTFGKTEMGDINDSRGVNEIMIMGYVAPEVQYTTQRPLIELSEEVIEKMGTARFEMWKRSSLEEGPDTMVTNGKMWTTTHSIDGIECVRVIFDAEGKCVDVVELVEFKPRENPKSLGGWPSE